MSKTFTDDVYVYSGQATSCLAAIEDNFAALKSSFSDLTTPSDLVAGMQWFDMTLKSLKFRNSVNNAWLGIMQADASHKIWVWRNSAPDGWVIDAAVVDVVLALKGGANAYNANGGTQAGSWTQPDCTLTAAQSGLPAHTHTMDIGNIGRYYLEWASGPTHGGGLVSTSSTGPLSAVSAHNHGTTYRPAAAIGTLQYLSL